MSNNEIEKEKFDDFVKLQKEYKKRENVKRKNKIKYFLQHILFFVFPGTFIEHSKNNKVAKNILSYGLQGLGIIMQLLFFVLVFDGIKSFSTGISTFITQMLYSVFVFVGGLSMRIIGAKIKNAEDIQNSIFYICACVIFMLLVLVV